MTPTTEQLKGLMAKVTPGEWYYETGPAFKGTYNAITDGDGELIADCWEKDDEQAAQDAALIALAPTLAAEVVRLRASLRMIEAIGVAHSDTFERQIAEARSIARQALDATSNA